MQASFCQTQVGRVVNDENFVLRHTGAGCLSTANSGPDSNTAFFQLSLDSMPFLDGIQVVFGCIADSNSLNVLHEISRRYGSGCGAPSSDVFILSCGQL